MEEGKKQGRPTKYSEALSARLCELLEGGNTRKAACHAVGISEDALGAWLARSESDDQADAVYSGFADRVKAAEGAAEPALVAVLYKAATGYEKRKTKIKRRSVVGPKGEPIIGADGKPLYIEEQETTIERDFDWRAALEILKRRFGGGWGDSLQLRGSSDDDLLELAEKLGLAAMEPGAGEDLGDEPEEEEGAEE